MSSPLVSNLPNKNIADAKARVMIVDDSAVFRGLVSQWLIDEGLDVIARHANGDLAVKNISTNNPDIVILDIEMPVMDGLTALPKLLKCCPNVKIIMASTLTRRNAEVSLKALSLGAVDYIPKPETNRGITTSVSFRQDLVAKIFALSGAPQTKQKKSETVRPVKPVLKSVEKFTAPINKPAVQQGKIVLRPFSKVPPRIVAIGSSTGGPQALMGLMKEIGPGVLNVPVVITQHMPPTFTTILAEHLTTAIGRPVKEGEHGEEVKAGGVYVAPGQKHMLLEARQGKNYIILDDGPPVNFCKPAVDPMFACVSKLYKAAVLSLVLTGMGQDGAVGAGQIADAGGSVLAQDEASSVVWGMPGATAHMGNASAVLPLDRIGQKVINLVKGGS
ncbi:MAG: chemotaxis response regulator protein-glutamate methylesterase [Pseudomonadota bacterium]